ncbi:nitrate- and nitrite sensing domain-containing protein [Actinoplanes sp. NPDC000266]
MTGGQHPDGTARRRWLKLADRPIRTKLALLLVAPVAAIVCLSLVLVLGARSAAAQADQARRLVGVGAVAGELAGQLQRERAGAALVFAVRSSAPSIAGFERQARSTDEVRDRFGQALAGVRVPGGLQPLVLRLRTQLDGLPLLREQVRAGRDATASVIVFRYRALLADLGGYRAAMSQVGVDADTADGLRAAATLSQAIESLGLLQVAVLPALQAGEYSAAAQQQVVAADAGFAQALEAVRQLAAPQLQARLAARTGSKAVVSGERLQALAASSLPGRPLAVGVGPEQFAAAVTARMDQLHQVEAELDASLVNAVTAQRDAQQQQTALLGSAVVVFLILLGLLAWRLTRSLTAPLRDLHAGAATLADTTLPTMVDELIKGSADETAVAAAVQRAGQAVRVHGRDEVGTVAAAFNNVAAVAARLAGQQAAARGLNYQIVRTLGHRLRLMVNHVTSSLDDLERNEEDPRRLELLFAADQKVTSANRTVNNLLVIAGGRPQQSVERPIPVPDVVKAAISWAEGASVRVRDGQVTGDCLIVPEAVDALLHILAELLANALAFSHQDTAVTVSSAIVGDRLHLHIADEGIGLPDDTRDQIHHRLAHFDLAVAARHMGIPVIGLLAREFGLEITFRARPTQGTGVDVIVPSALLIMDSTRGLPATMPPPARDVPPRPATVAPTASHPPVPQPAPALMAPAAAALAGATRELLPVAGRPAPGIDVNPLRLEIYETLLDDNPYFTAAQGPDSPGPQIADTWRDSAAAAQRAHRDTAALTAGSTEQQTRNGLPMRRPGQFAMPTPAAPRIPVPRTPAATRQGMAALTRVARKQQNRVPPRQIGWK